MQTLEGLRNQDGPHLSMFETDGHDVRTSFQDDRAKLVDNRLDNLQKRFPQVDIMGRCLSTPGGHVWLVSFWVFSLLMSIVVFKTLYQSTHTDYNIDT